MLSRNAGSTVVTVLSLALGIGINTAVFTAYKAMVARPLDARAPAEMVNLALIRDSGAADYRARPITASAIPTTKRIGMQSVPSAA